MTRATVRVYQWTGSDLWYLSRHFQLSIIHT